ncbi:MAG TPA: DUF6600 domain-containing protein [Ignavibacteriaceae bacterium]
MKKLIIAAVLIVFSLSASADANANYAKRVGGYFYTSLSPYGTWIEIGFGTPVWRPTLMKRNWSPYSQGQWIYTNYGWYWNSYEPFGDVVYHYGRWYYDDYYGWIWIPDYEWAPAWVEWRYDDDYIGWAPLSPYAVFSINIGIHYTYDYYVPYYHWNYVQYNHFCDNNVYNYYVAPKYKYRVHNKTKMRTNYSYYDGRVRNDGVGYNEIRERSGRTIEKRDLVGVSDPRELTKDRDFKRRDTEIRTYFVNKDDISRDGLRDVKVEKKDRKSTLELSKVELGRDRNNDRIDNRKLENREKDLTLDSHERSKDTREQTNNDIIRRSVEDEKKIQEQKDLDKRNSDIEKRNNEQIKRNDEIRKSEEVKRIEQNKRNEQVDNHRSTNVEMKKRIEETIQKRQEKKSNTEVFKQNSERKVEQKKETQRVEQRNNNSVNRNTEVKRNDTNNKTETKGNTRTSEKDNKTKSR